MLLPLYIIWAAYFAFLLTMIIGWLKASQAILNHEQHSINVIVPFRNEAKNLEKLIISLQNQAYKDFEVTFINDHSVDNSKEIIVEMLEKLNLNWQLIDLTNREGKKAAIETGVKNAAAAIIITTDADCWMGPNWLNHINKAFEKRIQMVVGPVRLTGEKTFLNLWQELEFSTLIGTGGAMINLNAPLMCNGANLAYRKTAFEKVKGFEGIDQSPSGDDELLMSKFNKEFPKGIRFVKHKEAVVATNPSKSWAEFMHQRKRWASKWKLNRRPTTMIVVMLVLFFHLAFVVTLGLAVVGIFPLPILIFLISIKFVFELAFVKLVGSKLGNRFDLISFTLSQVFYSFYTILFGLLANFGNYKWKGRSYKI